ncbi:MAG: hypothetical protein ACLTXL_12550 [Clostridia bacterium]
MWSLTTRSRESPDAVVRQGYNLPQCGRFSGIELTLFPPKGDLDADIKKARIRRFDREGGDAV